MTLDELIEQCEDETVPYIERVLDESTVYRVFRPNTPEHVLKWHWDDEDREIKILVDTDWKFQFDNKIPQVLQKNEIVKVKAGEYHRIIKGSTYLAVKINKKK